MQQVVFQHKENQLAEVKAQNPGASKEKIVKILNSIDFLAS